MNPRKSPITHFSLALTVLITLVGCSSPVVPTLASIATEPARSEIAKESTLTEAAPTLPATQLLSPTRKLSTTPTTTPPSEETNASEDIEFNWARSQGVTIWTKTGMDVYSSSFVDLSGAIYTTGGFEGTADFDPGTNTFNLTGAGERDIFITKLDSGGGFVWARALGGKGDDMSTSIFGDASGNIYMTGWFSEIADFDPGPADFDMKSAGDTDIFISKLDSAGNFIWAKALGGEYRGESGIEMGRSIFVDKEGQVYTTGEFLGTGDFDPGVGTFELNSSGGGIFVSMLDSAGSFVWAKAMAVTAETAGWAGSNDIFVDGAGNVYTAGWIWTDADFDPGPGVFTLVPAQGWDAFVSKLDSAGNFVWAKVLGGYGVEAVHSIFVDREGNVYTTGEFSDTSDFDPGPGTFELTDTSSCVSGLPDIFISKLDSAGNFIWAKALGSAATGFGKSIFVDRAGDIYTTGRFEGWCEDSADFDPGPGDFNLTSIGIFVSKLNSAGEFIWAKALGGVVGNSIFVDGVGNVYITGLFQGSGDFDPGPESFNLIGAHESAYDIFISKLGIKSTLIEPSPTPAQEVPSPTPAPTAEPIDLDAPVTVSGKICPPDDDIPKRMAYFENLETHELNLLTMAKDQTTYSLDLLPGQYIAYAYEKGKDVRGGMYSEAVPCGLTAGCTGHNPLVFEVKPGKALSGIDICDWSAPEQVPANPAPNDPRLAGMVYTLYGVNYFYYDEQGEAHFVMFNPFLFERSIAYPLQISPDRTRGVFRDEEKNDLFLVDFTTGKQFNLTNTPLIEETSWWWEPKLPNLILFMALREGEGREPGYWGMLYAIRVDGPDLGVIDPEHHPIISSVSPDGGTIAYGGGSTGFLYNWGTGVSEFDPRAYNPGLPEDVFISSPSWSPDGKKIAWHLRGSSEEFQNGYGIFDLGAKTLQLAHPYPGNGYGGYPGAAEWSPNGKWFVLPIHASGLWLVNTSQPEEEYFLGKSTYNRAWHPKGKWLAYTRQDEYGGGQFSEVWVLSPDKPEKRMLMGKLTFEPEWSPDGEWLAYTQREGGIWTSEVWLYNPKTGERLSMGASTLGPEWNPDGKWLAYQRILAYPEDEVGVGNYEVWLYNLETGKSLKTSLPPQVQDVDW